MTEIITEQATGRQIEILGKNEAGGYRIKDIATGQIQTVPPSVIQRLKSGDRTYTVTPNPPPGYVEVLSFDPSKGVKIRTDTGAIETWAPKAVFGEHYENFPKQTLGKTPQGGVVVQNLYTGVTETVPPKAAEEMKRLGELVVTPEVKELPTAPPKTDVERVVDYATKTASAGFVGPSIRGPVGPADISEAIEAAQAKAIIDVSKAEAEGKLHDYVRPIISQNPIIQESYLYGKRFYEGLVKPYIDLVKSFASTLAPPPEKIAENIAKSQEKIAEMLTTQLHTTYVPEAKEKDFVQDIKKATGEPTESLGPNKTLEEALKEAYMSGQKKFFTIKEQQLLGYEKIQQWEEEKKAQWMEQAKKRWEALTPGEKLAELTIGGIQLYGLAKTVIDLPKFVKHLAGKEKPVVSLSKETTLAGEERQVSFGKAAAEQGDIKAGSQHRAAMQRVAKVGGMEKWAGVYEQEITIRQPWRFGFTKETTIELSDELGSIVKKLSPEDIEKLRLQSPDAYAFLMKTYGKEGAPVIKTKGIAEKLWEKQVPGSLDIKRAGAFISREYETKSGWASFSLSKSEAGKGLGASMSDVYKIKMTYPSARIEPQIRPAGSLTIMGLDEQKAALLRDFLAPKTEQALPTTKLAEETLKTVVTAQTKPAVSPTAATFAATTLLPKTETKATAPISQQTVVSIPSEAYFSKVGTIAPKTETKVVKQAFYEPLTEADTRDILNRMILPTRPTIRDEGRGDILSKLTTSTEILTTTKQSISQRGMLGELSASLEEELQRAARKAAGSFEQQRYEETKESFKQAQYLINLQRLTQKVVTRTGSPSRTLPPSFPTDIPVIKPPLSPPDIHFSLPKGFTRMKRRDALLSFYFERIHPMRDISKLLGIKLPKVVKR